MLYWHVLATFFSTSIIRFCSTSFLNFIVLCNSSARHTCICPDSGGPTESGEYPCSYHLQMLMVHQKIVYVYMYILYILDCIYNAGTVTPYGQSSPVTGIV